MKRLFIFFLVSMVVAPSETMANLPTVTVSASAKSQVYDADYDLVYSAAVGALQDANYDIGSRDETSGLTKAIGATKSRSTFAGYRLTKRTPVASMFIERLSDDRTTIRVSLLETENKEWYGRVYKDNEVPAELPAYQFMFTTITSTLAARKSH